MPHSGRGPHHQQFGHGHRPRDRDAAQVVADQVDDHDVLGDVLDRRPQRRRIRVPRQRALDRARRHRLTAAPQEQLRRQRRHRTPLAGQIGRPRGRRALHGVDEEVDRRAVDAARELRAHARLVDLARRDRLQALEHAAAVRIAVGLAPRDAVRPRRHAVIRSASATHGESGAPERLSYHHCPSRSCRSTQSDQPPAASGIRGPSPSAPASGYDR